MDCYPRPSICCSTNITVHSPLNLPECCINRRFCVQSLLKCLCCTVTASPLSPSFAHWCLSCSALPCLILPPSPSSRLGGLLYFQLCLSLPLQELTSRSTFRSARRRSVSESTAGIGWRREEVWGTNGWECTLEIMISFIQSLDGFDGDIENTCRWGR